MKHELYDLDFVSNVTSMVEITKSFSVESIFCSIRNTSLVLVYAIFYCCLVGTLQAFSSNLGVSNESDNLKVYLCAW